MKDYNTLKGEIQRYIRANNNQEITGEVLQSVLISIVSNVGENAGFSGIAKKTTSPGTPDGPVFYFATEQGVYPNFGGLEIEKENTLNIIYNTDDGWGALYLGNLVSDEEISELIYRIQGRSENSSAYYDPFISLGDIKGWPAFTDKLDGISDISELEKKQKYMGRCRARVDGITVEVYHFINSFRNKDFSQVVLGNVSAIKDEQGKWHVNFTPNQFNIIHRQHKGGEWTDWQSINEHPLATPSLDGLMSADDKRALDEAKSNIESLQTGKANNIELNEAKKAITANAGQISDLTKLSQGDPEKSSAYTCAFINLGEFSGWDVFSSKLDDIAKLDTIPFQKYMGRCRAKVSGITIELYNFINNFRNKDFSQVVLGNVSAIKDEQGKWHVNFTPNQFNIIHRQHKGGEWTDWQSINEHPLATPSLDGLMSADDKKALDSVDSSFKNLEAMHFEEASEYCATFDNIIEKIEGGAIRFSKPTIFTFSGRDSGQGMIINLPSSGGLITQFAFLKATANGGFSRRIIQYNPHNFTITNVGEWRPISDLIPAATTSAAGIMSAADKGKLDNYPSNFVLDLGLVDSQEAGEQEAAKSEVAGNRNISFIRFQVQGVRALRTTLILQWPNGENYTAQIKFTDKTEWRRNVTGATGVAGAATAATQWERTAPHYLGYDAARRMIQLKDYTQTVSREAELPLATSTQHGLMSAADKGDLDATKAKATELLQRLKGESENSSAYTDPFISLDEFNTWPDLSTALNSLDEKKYMGRCRAKVSGVTVEVYQFINSFSKKDYTQVLLGNVSPGENGQVKFTANQFNIIHRQHTGDAWSPWQRINDHPTATSSSDGLMSAADKEKLNNYPEQFVLDLGILNSHSEGESIAASSEVAGNRNISFIRFQVQEQDRSNLKTTLIMQWPDGSNVTGQIMFTDQSQFRRSVTGASGVSGVATNAFPWERTSPHHIAYDKSRRMIQLKDYLNLDVKEVELPLATPSQHGLMSAGDKNKITALENRVAALEAALEAQLSSNTQ